MTGQNQHIVIPSPSFLLKKKKKKPTTKKGKGLCKTGQETKPAEIPGKQSISKSKSDTDQTNTGTVHQTVQRKHCLDQGRSGKL